MYTSDGRLVVSASDLCGWLACDHLGRLELDAARHDRARPRRAGDALDVLRKRGAEHERAWLERRRAAGARIVEIGVAQGLLLDALRAAEAATLAALRAGSDVVYQATFLDERAPNPLWRGHADFLERVERPSGLGPWSYEPVDTKLARRVKVDAVLQLCHYADSVARLVGVEPDSIRVVLGTHEVVDLRLSDFAAYYRTARRRYEAALDARAEPTYPHPIAHCALCDWEETCRGRREADDHPSLVAGIRREDVEKLRQAGILTLGALAACAPDRSVHGLSRASFERLRRQASLQVRRRAAGDAAPPPFEALGDGRAENGLAALPAPSAGDLYFDMEGDPHVAGGLEYLFGVGSREEGRFVYRDFWAHDAAEEKRAFEAFVDFVSAALARDPALHVYHYAPYERTALGRLAGRHATREAEVDALLRGGVLVDLYAIVRRGLAIGVESYSLKKLEPLYMPRREGAITDAGSSIVEYERWIEERDPAILESLRAYNRDDCESTALLHAWLEERRAEVERASGALVRPAPRSLAASDAQVEIEAETEALVGALTAGLPEDPAARTDEQHARFVLAQLLGWHRREAKPEWWRYFERLEMSADELFEDTECLSGLEHEGVVGRVRKSELHRYRFDPEQEHKAVAHTDWIDPATEEQFKIDAIDVELGTIDLAQSKAKSGLRPLALMPGGPVRTKEQRVALARVARSVIASGFDDHSELRAVCDLLVRRAPRCGQPEGADLRRAGETGREALIRLATSLDRGALAVQGPPGSGKTSSGARMVVELVRLGRTVGITANSHAVIGNFLTEMLTVAAERGIVVRTMQKADEGKRCTAPGILHTDANPDVVAALDAREVDVLAGTSWLFAREDVAGKIDTLVIDEAGQFSLANAVAVGSAAKNLVLLGDPQQLAMPSKGTHPECAAVSALDHAIDGRPTMPSDRGLFLERTYRLHDDVCAFVSELSYERRLVPVEACRHQTILGAGELTGSGLRWIPVEHVGNRTSSSEEAAAIERAVVDLLARRWVDARGVERALGVEEILVVAPYNAQVARLAARLHANARIGPGLEVGTVDRFQGKEAAVVLLSMGASSAEDVPRGLSFLYSRNRLNVAVSRARALAVLVCSPELLHARCRTIEELGLVNALCRFVERCPGSTIAT